MFQRHKGTAKKIQNFSYYDSAFVKGPLKYDLAFGMITLVIHQNNWEHATCILYDDNKKTFQNLIRYIGVVNIYWWGEIAQSV